MKQTHFLSKIGFAVGIAVSAVALSALGQTTWTPPSATAPGNNVDTPLNVGSTAQTKQGGSIQINGGFGIAGGPFVFLPTGVTQTAGMVLASDPSTPGKVVWTATSTLGLGGPTGNGGTSVSSSTNTGVPAHIMAYTTPGSYTWTVPSGVTHVRVKIWGSGGGYTCNGVGGGGAYIEIAQTVVPGSNQAVVVGALGPSGAGQPYSASVQAPSSSFGSYTAQGGYSSRGYAPNCTANGPANGAGAPASNIPGVGFSVPGTALSSASLSEIDRSLGQSFGSNYFGTSGHSGAVIIEY